MHGCFASYLLTVLYCLICSTNVNAEPVPPTEGRETFTINFFKPGDSPPAVPYMSITFRNLSEEHKKAVSNLQNEIDTALNNQGGVVNDEDYIRLLEVLPAYILRLRELGIKSARISLPHERIGMYLYQE